MSALASAWSGWYRPERVAPGRHRGARADRVDERHPAAARGCRASARRRASRRRPPDRRTGSPPARRPPRGCGGAGPRRARRVVPVPLTMPPVREASLASSHSRSVAYRSSCSAVHRNSSAAWNMRVWSATNSWPHASARGLRHVSTPANRSSAMAGVRSSSTARARSSRARARNVDASWFVVTAITSSPHVVPRGLVVPVGDRADAGVGSGQRVRTMS